MLKVIDALECFWASSSHEHLKALEATVIRYAQAEPADVAYALDGRSPLSPHHIALVMAIVTISDWQRQHASPANDNQQIDAAYAASSIEIHQLSTDEQRRIVERSLKASAHSFEVLKKNGPDTFCGASERLSV